MDRDSFSDIDRIFCGEKPGMIDFGKDWPEAKWRVFENIWVYLGLIGFNLAFDWIVNLSGFAGFNRGGEAHPYSLGLFQDLFFIFCTIQLMRMLNQWKYYGRFPWEK